MNFFLVTFLLFISIYLIRGAVSDIISEQYKYENYTKFKRVRLDIGIETDNKYREPEKNSQHARNRKNTMKERATTMI